MPEKDNDMVHWVLTPALAYVNDRYAPSSDYWLSFRDAAEELYRAYPELSDVPAGIDVEWNTLRFRRMRDLYKQKWPSNQESQAGAFQVIRAYREMKILGQYNGDPIELFSVGDGGSGDDNSHAIEIAGSVRHYSQLNGNHRLMSAYFLAIDRTPVLLKTKPARSNDGGGSST